MVRSRVDHGVDHGHGVVGERPLTRRRTGGRILPRETALADGRVGQRDHTELGAGGQQPTRLGQPSQQRKLDLIGGQSQIPLAQLGRDGPGLLHRVVRDTDRLDQTGLVRRRQGVGQSGVGTETDGAVDLVEIDARHLQPSQRGPKRLQQGAPDVHLPGRRHELGGQHDRRRPGRVVATQLPDDPFALTPAVDLGRVEQGDAGIDGGVPGAFDRRHGQIGSYPPMPQVDRSPQAQVPTPRGGMVTSLPASV